MHKYILIILFLFTYIVLYGQDGGGIERHFKSYKLDAYAVEDYSIYRDTTIDDLFNFLPQYKLSKHFFGYVNPGTPVVPMLYSFQKNNHSFYFFNNYYPYISNHNQIIYFDTQKPFTSFTFTGGAKEMELVRFFHTQNVNPLFNFGMDVNIINSDGHYMNNKGKINTISLFTAYTKRRYQSHANFIFNKISHFENGGIANDSIFENTDIRAENVDVNLMNAQNTISQLGFQYNHEYRFGKFSLDTVFIEEDTVLSKTYKGKASVIQSVKADRYYRIYSDIPGNFYKNIYTDSLMTYDSTGLKHFEHGFFLNYHIINSDDDSIQLKLMGGIKNEFFDYNYNLTNNFYKYHYLSGNMLFKDQKHFLLANFDYCFAGTGVFDMGLEVMHDYKLSKNLSILSLFNYNFKDPDRILYNYESNHFVWSNDFNKILNIGGKSALYLKKYNLNFGANINFLNNYVIFNEHALPEQIESSNIVADVFVNKKFNLGKFFWDNQFSWQYVHDKSYLPLPQYLAYTSIYFKTPLFKNAAIFQTGVSGIYHGGSYGYAYMPATGAYYLQNQKKTGDYYMFSYHICVQVKRLRGFVRVSNFNTMFMPRGTYLMLNVPDNPFAINFGINWEFYN